MVKLLSVILAKTFNKSGAIVASIVVMAYQRYLSYHRVWPGDLNLGDAYCIRKHNFHIQVKGNKSPLCDP